MESEKVKEIKKDIEICTSRIQCEDCSLVSIMTSTNCRNELLKNCLTLINELESENEKLKNEYLTQARLLGQMGYNDIQECKKLKDRIAELEKVYDRQVRIINDLHIEVVKEQEKLPKFAERLKEKIHERDYVQGYAEIGLCEDIDETLKEMLGEE